MLILGGSSATGAAAIQLLRIAYPLLPIYATSSPKHHEHLASLGATKLFDYNSATVVSDIKNSTPESKGVDMIIDCVASGAVQKDVFDAFDPAGSKMYAASITGVDVPVPEGVTKLEISGWALLDLQGGQHVIPSLTKLVEELNYKVPLPVKVVGHGLEQVPEVMDQSLSASGEKLVVML
jgi:NADPH:quinone reductase-like Zn-dependent oxidoreductase